MASVAGEPACAIDVEEDVAMVKGLYVAQSHDGDVVRDVVMLSKQGIC